MSNSEPNILLNSSMQFLISPSSNSTFLPHLTRILVLLYVLLAIKQLVYVVLLHFPLTKHSRPPPRRNYSFYATCGMIISIQILSNGSKALPQFLNYSIEHEHWAKRSSKNRRERGPGRIEFIPIAFSILLLSLANILIATFAPRPEKSFPQFFRVSVEAKKWNWIRKSFVVSKIIKNCRKDFESHVWMLSCKEWETFIYGCIFILRLFMHMERGNEALERKNSLEPRCLSRGERNISVCICRLIYIKMRFHFMIRNCFPPPRF